MPSGFSMSDGKIEIYNANVIGKCSRCDADILKDQDVCVVCGQQIKDI